MRSRHDRPERFSSCRGDGILCRRRHLLHDLLWQGAKGLKHPPQPESRADDRDRRQLCRIARRYGARHLRNHRGCRNRAAGHGPPPWQPSERPPRLVRQRPKTRRSQNNPPQDRELGPHEARWPILEQQPFRFCRALRQLSLLEKHNIKCQRTEISSYRLLLFKINSLPLPPPVIIWRNHQKLSRELGQVWG